MSETLTITRVNNPIRRRIRTEWVRDYKGETVEQLLADCTPQLKDVSFAVYVNGLEIPKYQYDTCVPRPNDYVAFIPIIEGGDDSSLLAAVAMLALTMVAPHAAFMLWGTGAGLGAALTKIAFVAAGGLLISEMAKAPDKETQQLPGREESPVYSFQPSTIQQQGLVRPRWYGQNRLRGNVIASHTAVSAYDHWTIPHQVESLNVLIALGEGPVQGIVAGSMRINDQPIANYSDVSTEEKKGESNQTHVSFFDETMIEYRPDILVTNSGGAQTYTTSGDDFDELEIQLKWPKGNYNVVQGGLVTSQIGYKIEISVKDAGSWTTLVDDTIGGLGDPPRAATRQLNFRTDTVYTGGSAVSIVNGNHYDIKVTKTTSDQTAATYADDMILAVVREVQQTSYRYPYQSLVGIQGMATDKLHGSIDFSCEQQGRIVNVYDGATWSLEYSNNPAWVLFDILTQPVIKGASGSYEIERYEGVNPSRLDTAKFYELAEWCDDLIDDGKGGTEARITFNGGFDAGTTVWEAALQVCEIARCVLVWDGYEITLAIDKAETASQMFTVGNIALGNFQRHYLPQAERISELEIYYRDSEQNYEMTPFTIFDTALSNSSNKLSLSLIGTTKQTEAWRHGKYRLNQNRLIDHTIEFLADIDSLACTIGDVVYVQHDVPDWQEGGRVVSANANSITVDKAVTASGTDSVLVRVYNSSTEEEEIEDHAVSSVSGKTITITDTFSIIPKKNDVFIFGPTTTYKRKYRIVGIARDSEQRAKIAAVQYDEAVFDMDSDTPERPITNIQPPYSATRDPIWQPPRNDVIPTFPAPGVNWPINLKVPLVYIEFISLGVGKVGWTEGSIVYKGETYVIAAESTGDTNKYIYWNEGDTPTDFHTTNTLSEAWGEDKFVVCVNDAGTPRPIGLGMPYFGEMIAVETLAAITAQLGDVLAGSITGTFITGATITTADSGKRLTMDSSGLRLMYASSGGLFGTVGNGGSGLVYGTTGAGGSNAVYGSGVLASINHPDENVPFYVHSEQIYGDIHLYPRSSDPSGAADIGDTIMIDGEVFVCTSAGTPGTWEPACRYTKRGDPSAFDLSLGSMTTDGANHDWDISSIVGTGKRFVHLRVDIQDDAAGSTLDIRMKGQTNSHDALTTRTQVSGVTIQNDGWVMTDDSGVVEYIATNTTWSSIELLVRGWFAMSD